VPTALGAEIHLNQALQVYQDHALSLATRSVYNCGKRTFLLFCAMYGVQNQHSFPRINEDVLIYFCVHCAHVLHLSYSTIRSYLCGVRSYYIQGGCGNPMQTATGAPLYHLEMVLRGIRKSQVTHAQAKLPISAELLRQLCMLLRAGYFSPYLDGMLEALLVIGWFGAFRSGELVVKGPFDPIVNLTVSDANCTTDMSTGVKCVQINLKCSKTDPFRLGCTVTLFATGSDLCPYTALEHFMSMRSPAIASQQEPLFMYIDRQPLSRQVFLGMLHKLLSTLGLDPNNYGGHSLRKGMATEASKLGIPDHVLATLGRWNSDCYRRYITMAKSTIMQAHTTLGAPSTK
jgi:hypothetical protein